MFDVSAYLDSKFGTPDTPSRIAAEEKAWQEYNEQILLDTRREAAMTQEE